MKKSLIAAILAIAAAVTLSGCEGAEFTVDDVRAQWAGREATVQTFDNNSGQTTASIRGKSVYPFRNTKFDVATADGSDTKKGSVVSVSVGNNVVDLVGSSTIVCEDGVRMIDRRDIDIAVNDAEPAIPWLNLLKRNVSDVFTGQPRLAVVKTQNDVPVAAFTADSVTMVSGNEDIPNSTWFKVQDGGESFYCWVYRVNYLVIDTALL